MSEEKFELSDAQASLLEEVANKIANRYEDIFGTYACFDNDKEEINELEKQENVKLPIFVLFLSSMRMWQSNKNGTEFFIPIRCVFSSEIIFEDVFEKLRVSTPRKLKGVKINMLKKTDLVRTNIEEEDAEVHIYEYPIIGKILE